MKLWAGNAELARRIRPGNLLPVLFSRETECAGDAAQQSGDSQAQRQIGRFVVQCPRNVANRIHVGIKPQNEQQKAQPEKTVGDDFIHIRSFIDTFGGRKAWLVPPIRRVWMRVKKGGFCEKIAKATLFHFFGALQNAFKAATCKANSLSNAPQNFL